MINFLCIFLKFGNYILDFIAMSSSTINRIRINKCKKECLNGINIFKVLGFLIMKLNNLEAKETTTFTSSSEVNPKLNIIPRSLSNVQ